jgi:hypothetical protein
MAQDQRRIRQEIEATRASMGDTVEALSYKTDVPARAREAVTGKKDAVVARITGVKDAIVGTAGDVTSTVGDAVSDVTEALPDGAEVRATAVQAASVAQQNPLGLAIGAAAVGFLAGMVIKSTRFEDEHLGMAADAVKERIADTAQEVVEQGKQVAQETVAAAVETAQTSGQEHAQQLAETAQRNAQEAVASATAGQ